MQTKQIGGKVPLLVLRACGRAREQVSDVRDHYDAFDTNYCGEVGLYCGEVGDALFELGEYPFCPDGDVGL